MPQVSFIMGSAPKNRSLEVTDVSIVLLHRLCAMRMVTKRTSCFRSAKNDGDLFRAPDRDDQLKHRWFTWKHEFGETITNLTWCSIFSNALVHLHFQSRLDVSIWTWLNPLLLDPSHRQFNHLKQLKGILGKPDSEGSHGSPAILH